MKKPIKPKIKKKDPNLEFVKGIMDKLNVNDKFLSMNIESTKISSMRFKEKKFKTEKRIIVDPIIKEGLTGQFDICYLITRIE